MDLSRRPHALRTAIRRRPGAILAMGLLLGVSVAMAVASPVAASSIERVLVIDEASAGPQVAWKAFDGNPPKVYDFDGDGQLEIIAQNDNHWAYVFDSQDGSLLAELKAKVPSGWGARTFNGAEAAVLSVGGDPYLIQASSAAYITAWRFDASRSDAGSFHFGKAWERRLDLCFEGPGMDAKPVLADLNQDGHLEIVAATEQSGVYALRHDGSILWHKCIGGGNAAPGIGDLNGDGYPDVIHVSDGGHVAALDGRHGNWLWGFDVRSTFNLGSASIPVQPAVGQLDGRDGPDIVLGARDSHDPDDWDNDHAMILALDSHGDVLWSHQHPAANPLTYTRPVIADADKDGVAEVYWADWNTVGHKPPWDPAETWARTGPANFYRYSHTGALEWRTQLDTWWSNKDIAIGDVDGDGAQEVVANGPSNDGSKDGLWLLDVETGAKKEFVSVYPYKVKRAPILADLWNTGTMQWVVQVAAATSSGADAVLVYDTHAPFDALWPHVPYPDDPAAGGGDFQAQFSDVRGNEWWIQTKVHSSGGTLSQVHARLDGGPWRALEDKGWGWAASYHAPEGTQVQLRATSTTGDADLSGCYRWIAATPEPCGGGGGGGFTAKFDPASGVNAWWVEVYVSGSKSIDRVDARVNGAEWQALAKKDWGSWAKSMHAPQGSIVQFRAVASDGDTALSACYRWTDAATTQCSDGFTAKFEPASGVNAWWVEVYVSGNEPIARVDARVDGGTWKQLSKTDWGSWAKSMHAPDGSRVQFRATSDDGDTALSREFVWG